MTNIITDKPHNINPYSNVKEGVLSKLNKKDKIFLLGEVTSLMLASKLHHQYFINDIAAMFLTPININQFRLYKNQNQDLVALITWACLSQEIEKKYLTGKYFLKPDDWRSGDRIWIIDFLAPFGHLKQVRQDLKNNLFPNYHAKSLRIKADGTLKGIQSWYGKDYLKNQNLKNQQEQVLQTQKKSKKPKTSRKKKS